MNTRTFIKTLAAAPCGFYAGFAATNVAAKHDLDLDEIFKLSYDILEKRKAISGEWSTTPWKIHPRYKTYHRWVWNGDFWSKEATHTVECFELGRCSDKCVALVKDIQSGRA